MRGADSTSMLLLQFAVNLTANRTRLAILAL